MCFILLFKQALYAYPEKWTLRNVPFQVNMGYEFMQCQNSYIAFMRKCKWLIFIACT